ncbi:acyltransferase [Solibacillus merdavium]|uniref:Acyltransferase n=1 Tax=Solibacillus merdavium TaxID=2762218 RepID=A0ABR8XKV4_9BACL|nr:acyltransferase [Solibacillus merdavium]MBD8032564.1 acyltransferase [Solibacillus merdavium]
MKREVGIDLIKVIAVFFVPSVHFFMNTYYYSTPLINSELLFLQTYLRWLFLICVPLFMMVTGYVMSQKKLKKNYYKGLINVIGVYLFYSLLSIVMRITYFKEDLSVIEWLYKILSFEANGYGWYVNMYLGLFLLIPFINIIFNNLKSENEKKALIITLIVLTGLPGLLNSIPLYFQGSKILYFPNWWINIYPLTYYFIGCYFKEYQPKIKKYKAISLCALIILIETILTFYFAQGGIFVEATGYYSSLTVMGTAIFFFLAIYDIKIKNLVLNKIFIMIGGMTLDIYLASYIFDRMVYPYALRYFENQALIIIYFVPVVASILVLSIISGIFRKKIVGFLYKLLKNKRLIRLKWT